MLHAGYIASNEQILFGIQFISKFYLLDSYDARGHLFLLIIRNNRAIEGRTFDLEEE